MTELEMERLTAEARASHIGKSIWLGLAAAQVMEADGINALVQTMLNILAHSSDASLRPQCVALLKEVVELLEAEIESKQAAARGGLQ